MSQQLGPGKRLPSRFYCLSSSQNNELRRIEIIAKSHFDESESPELFLCVLEGNWIQTKVLIGDVLHIFDPHVDDMKVFESPLGKCKQTLLINNDRGLIILNPDTLLPTTTLMGASHCMRKQWLQSMFNIYGETSLPLILGSAVHEIFQECLRRELYTVAEIRNLYETEIRKQMTFDFYALGTTLSDFQKEIEPYFQTVSRWLHLYMKKNYYPLPNEKKHFDVTRLHDIENEIWSTKYGVIGKMDITLEAKIRNDSTDTIKLIPLELKTGRANFSAAHMGQVIMYSYIIQDKYRQIQPNDGYLIYLKDEIKTETVKSNHSVFRDILILRNRYQGYHNKIMDLTSKITDIKMNIPAQIDILRFCNTCEYLTECSLFYNCFESKNVAHTGKNLFETAVSHLSTSDLEFFSKNITLLELEKQYAIHREQVHKFWNHASEDCEKNGNGLTKVEVFYQEKDLLKMKRTRKARLSPTLFDLFETPNNHPVNYSSFIGRRVMINEEILVSNVCFSIFGNYCKQTSCAVAVIESFNDDHTLICLRLEKNIITEFNPKAIYRIDLLSIISQRPMHTNFANIARLMSPSDDRAAELRDIVIRGKFPKTNINTSIVASLQKIHNSHILEDLNNNQRQAIIGVLRPKCSLIFGCPGSGKTQTIVTLVRVLHSLGFSVLVTSYTHVAVDNILLKLIQSNQKHNESVDFMRIGSDLRIHESVRKYSEHELTKNWLESGNVDALTTFYHKIPIVACTVLGVAGHAIFQKRTFDYCILDEASQVVLAASLGPLFMAKNFVLVGDQKQLPPVIQNANAKKDGLEESLFSRLLGFAQQHAIADKNSQTAADTDVLIDDVIVKGEHSPVKRKKLSRPNSIRVFPLFIQYRMNSAIMSLSNQITYSGKLTCGNKNVELATLGQFSAKKSLSSSGYLEHALSSELQDSVIFLDCDRIFAANEIQFDGKSCEKSSQDSNTGNLFGLKKPNQIGYVYNDFEAKLILRLVHELLSVYGSGGLNPSQIGIVSPFRKQVQRIKELIGDELIDGKGLEINTVDQYQGRDKEVIIYSCVKSFVQNGSAPLTPTSEFANDDESQSSTSTEASQGSVNSLNLFKTVVDSELLKDERRLNVAITRAKKKLIIVGNRTTLTRYEPFKQLFNVMPREMFVDLCDYMEDEAGLL